VKGRRVYTAAGIASAAAMAAVVAAGLAFSFASESRLPSADLRYMPRLRELVESGRLEEASDELHMVSLLDPRNQPALDMLAGVAEQLGQHGRRVQALKLLVIQNPSSPQLRLRYSRALVDRARASGGEPPRRQLERAISSAQLALRSDPRSAPAHATIGEAWLLLGDAEQAERHLSEALRIDPSLESVRRDLERARAAEGRS
jgi:tetratricopeptide (TPR) repeat protein